MAAVTSHLLDTTSGLTKGPRAAALDTYPARACPAAAGDHRPAVRQPSEAHLETLTMTRT